MATGPSPRHHRVAPGTHQRSRRRCVDDPGHAPARAILSHRARRGPGSLVRRHVDEYPRRHQGDDQRRAPEADERQRDPRDGQDADDRPDVDDRLAGDPARGGHRQQRAETVRCPVGGPKPVPGQDAEEAEDDQRPDQSPLLADHREDEVGVGVGQQPPFLPSAAQAEPVEMARAQSHQGLDHLVPRPLGVGEGVEEREQPRPAIRLGEPYHQAHRGRHPERFEHGTEGDPPA